MQAKANFISPAFSTILIVVSCLFTFFCQAQTLTNLRKVTVLPGQKNIQLDSTYRIDQTSLKFVLKNGLTSDLTYKFNAERSSISLDSLPKDTLILQYRIFPPLFSKPFYKKPESLIEPAMRNDPFAYDAARDGVFNTTDNGLKTDGNISRGISVGNSQDLVVNSNLNLRLGGKIADDVSITGVISDDNNPIQPEGNTQQLQDFDKVFIKLTKDSSNLIIGDFEMRQPGGYFMNYYKKSRGLHLDLSKNQKNAKVYTNLDAAISRGRFARNTIQGIEGNQGPYRLNGLNGETFIIIISGTEVVYLDGRRLSRGESRDYVINYNSGEITFMPAQMISKFSRIVVEFQYSDRNYQRTVFKSGIGLQNKNSLFEINYFTEQDNKNQNFQQSLDGYDSVRMLSAKQILALAGDSVQDAYIPRVKTIKPYDNSKLLYRKTDSLGFQNVYVFTQNPNSDTVFYDVVFSLVGNGNGNYRQKATTANGRVYQWVSPVNGIPQGDYEPIELLVAPKRFQMLTATVKRKFGNTETFLEGVYTKNDINTFSNFEKKNDNGFGLSAGVKNVLDITRGNKKYILTNQFKTELVNKNFRYLERYRPVEFERNWNKQLAIPVISTNALPEILANYDVTLDRSDLYKLNYKAAVYYRSQEVNGLSNQISGKVKYKNTQIQSFAERMTNTVLIGSATNENSFWNYDGDINQRFKVGMVGAGYHSEQSTFKAKTDSVTLGSFAYQAGRVYFESQDTGLFSYGVSGERRADKLPFQGALKSSTQADELKWHGGYTGKKGSRASLNGSFRSLQYLDTQVLKGLPEKNALGRLEADLPMLKKAVRWNTFYQIGTGQEQKREFTYLKVADGNGIYIWKDYDSNQIESLNEFEIASEYDRKLANYIRTFLPVQGFIKSRNIQFNQTLNLSSPVAWNKSKGVKHFLTRFAVLLVYRTDRRTTSNKPELYLNPFIFNVNDSQLLSSNSNWRTTLYINRNNPVWSADLSRINGQSKSLLVTGYETRKNTENTLNFRVNYSRNWGTVLQLIEGSKTYYSQLLATRNYGYNFYSAEPQLQFTSSGNNLGAALIGKYYQANTDTLSNRNLEVGAELRLSKAAKGSFTGNFRLVNIDFNGDASSPIGYELMKGLLPGKNYTWNVIYQQRISSNIQMDISYDGRKSEQSKVIHIGRVMARYLF